MGIIHQNKAAVAPACFFIHYLLILAFALYVRVFGEIRGSRSANNVVGLLLLGQIIYYMLIILILLSDLVLWNLATQNTLLAQRN